MEELSHTCTCSSTYIDINLDTMHMEFLTILSLSCITPAFVIRGKGDYQIDYVPAPRVTEADENNDRRYKLNF